MAKFVCQSKILDNTGVTSSWTYYDVPINDDDSRNLDNEYITKNNIKYIMINGIVNSGWGLKINHNNKNYEYEYNNTINLLLTMENNNNNINIKYCSGDRVKEQINFNLSIKCYTYDKLNTLIEQNKNDISDSPNIFCEYLKKNFRY